MNRTQVTVLLLASVAIIALFAGSFERHQSKPLPYEHISEPQVVTVESVKTLPIPRSEICSKLRQQRDAALATASDPAFGAVDAKKVAAMTAMAIGQAIETDCRPWGF